MLKAIIFDISGVVFTNGTAKFAKDIGSKYNIDSVIVKDLTNKELGTLYRENKISKDEFWKRFLEKLNINDNPNELEVQWVNGFKPIEGTRDIIKELSKKYSTYYLSDNAKEIAQGIEKNSEMTQWFTGGIYAWEAGMRKPSPEVYKLVLEKAKVQPSEAVFVDDKESNLLPANDLGIHTILFTSPEELRKELIELNLL